MKNDLERDLGLYATITISMGAMIGSGIFVLPALGLKKAGPAVILAYILAGLVVLPAALSKAEMATAMPESGGTYLYIDRAMGPLAGTVAGIGAWFSLVFKSSFALVGLGAYLLLLVPLSGGLVKAVALGLAVLIVVLNIVGTEQSGAVQSIIVTAVVLALAAYVLNAGVAVDTARFQGFTEKGAGGVVTAAAFVFVSYAGVTKIASVAEEVENPDRNLPLGMLGSMGLMMLVYTLVVGAVVGLNDPEVLSTSGPNGSPSLTPMADGAGQLLGGFGVVVIALVAILALTSMANAGVLASSRFPLAMSRDSLAPGGLARVSERFQTPRNAILLTGGLLVALIAFVPVVELAKLASAFQILVFSFENVALVAFRASGVARTSPPSGHRGTRTSRLPDSSADWRFSPRWGRSPSSGQPASPSVASCGISPTAGRGRTATEHSGSSSPDDATRSRSPPTDTVYCNRLRVGSPPRRMIRIIVSHYR